MNYIKITALLLSLLLIFNSGLIFVTFNDKSSSIALDKNKDYPMFNDKEFQGAEWLNNHTINNVVYSDNYGQFLLNSFGIQSGIFWGDSDYLENKTIFLRSFNLDRGLIYKSPMEVTKVMNLKSSNFYGLLKNRSLVYSNGGSQIYI